MDLLELKKRGFESYKKGDFNQALECFDTVRAFCTTRDHH
jgi:hypothetical protein